MDEALKKEIIKEDQSRWEELAGKVGKEVSEFFDDLTTGTVHLRQIDNEQTTTVAKVKIHLDGDCKLDYKADMLSPEEAWSIFTEIINRMQEWRMKLWTAGLKLTGLAKYFL